ncbi:MAG TPA: methyltransferase domain-containing protein [Steroidobacteraceae bacterium]|nr:methyltransferase domain-containing protein [Steroidobacteraceae bacterium]
MNAVLSRNTPRIDHRAAMTRRQLPYANMDYAAVGNALQVVSEELCESVNLCQEQQVLDVATGSFNASLAAARRWCDVTATDHASDLLHRSRQRREVESMGIRIVDGDVEGLPFGDQSFDAVLSCFGAMFAADQERAASEMIRVCRRGGRVGLTNWTPDGFIGQLFRIVHRHAVQAAAGMSCDWGIRDRMEELFGAYGNIETEARRIAFRCATPMDWVDRLRTAYLPVHGIFATLDAERKRALRSELLALVARFNRAKDGTMVVDAAYLEVMITRR